MKRYPILLVLLFVLLAQVLSDDAKWPVFFLKYDGSLESEETEEDIEQSAYRHTVSLRIKEEFSRVLTTNLLTTFSRKQFLRERGSYSYVAVNPYVSWDITDKVQLDQGLRSKWIYYDELDTEGLSKNFASLLFNTKLTFKPIKQIKIIPSVKGVYDLFQNETKTRQTYTFGLGINTTIDGVKLGGRYRAITRSALGEESDVTFRFNNEFGASLTLDPNR